VLYICGNVPSVVDFDFWSRREYGRGGNSGGATRPAGQRADRLVGRGTSRYPGMVSITLNSSYNICTVISTVFI
jgi:hypothetical protein